jgi:hypothetical protein
VRPLVRGHSLRVNVQGDPTIRVPQELLYGFDISFICLEQSAEGMTEGMPTDVFGDASFACNRLDVTLHEVVRPVRLFASHGRTCEDPIIIHRVRVGQS